MPAARAHLKHGRPVPVPSILCKAMSGRRDARISSRSQATYYKGKKILTATQKSIVVQESGSTTDTVCKENSTMKTQMLCITWRVGCSNSMKSCKDATDPSQYIPQLWASTLLQLTRLFKPHLHSMLSKWYSHIPAFSRGQTQGQH